MLARWRAAKTRVLDADPEAVLCGNSAEIGQELQLGENHHCYYKNYHAYKNENVSDPHLFGTASHGSTANYSSLAPRMSKSTPPVHHTTPIHAIPYANPTTPMAITPREVAIMLLLFEYISSP